MFVGGSVLGLLITDPAQPAIRPTEDVDLLAQVMALTGYHALGQELRSRGFLPDMRPEAPICRWRVDEVTVDVMPTRSEILGFSNRWYPLAAATARPATLPSGRTVQIISPAAFVATKLEAFAGRGQGDHLFSHDLGDAISVIDGRDALLSECRSAPDELRTYLSRRWADLLNTPSFLEALPGHLPGDGASQQRLPELLDKLGGLARLA